MLTMRHCTRARGRSAQFTRAACSVLLLAILGVACAGPTPSRDSEGTPVFRAGQAGPAPEAAMTSPGPTLDRLGVLLPGDDPTRQAAWVTRDPGRSAGSGTATGFTTGVGIIMGAPVILLFWPAAVGVVVGSTILGAAGEISQDPSQYRIAPPDRAAILEATTGLRANRLLQTSMAEALQVRTGRAVVLVPVREAQSPETSGGDPLVEARRQELDGWLDVRVEALGLAAGAEPETFGVFLQVRARIVEARDGRLRYERVLSYGPGQPVEGLPRPASYSLAFLAVGQASVFRYEVTQALGQIARHLAADPALPIAGR